MSLLRIHVAIFLCLLATPVQASPPDQPSTAPSGLSQEQELPSRYSYVVQDALRLCQPTKGFWVDLGAGKAQVTIPLIEATGNAVVMLDPDVASMTEGLNKAREKKLHDRLSAVVGVAEEMPFPNDSVDFLLSRGSIFFWDDPAQGLREVVRVLRPGGKAYIGGGAGSAYPAWAAEKLIQGRKDKMNGEEAEKWQKFVKLRLPKQMRQWAEDAKLTNYRILGQGAIEADPQAGQGIWLILEKPARKTD